MTAAHALFPSALFFLAVALFPGCGIEGGDEQRRPDVVLVVVDTLRSDRLHGYGYPRPTSPWLDARAGEGALFEDVTAQSSWTLPSMVSLMTGRYLTAYRDQIAEDVPTLAETFQQAGYRTLGVVGNILITEPLGFARGFDHFDPRPAPPAQPNGGGRKQARSLEQLAGDLWGPLDEALRAAAEPGGERAPLFLYLHPFDPHDPYHPHPELDGELPPGGAPPVEPRGWHRQVLDERGPPPPDDDPLWARELRGIDVQRSYYDQEVRYADDQLALVFERLKELGVLENAVVALVSDHGEGLWEHEHQIAPDKRGTLRPGEFFYQKHGGDLYEEAIATPLVLWGRGVPAGVRVSEAVENVDLFPTLLELAEVGQRGDLHGRSLVPLLEGGDWEPKPAVHSYIYLGASVREPATGLKLIAPTRVALHQGRELELYDLGSDPHERSNLAGERVADARRLYGAIVDWRKRYPVRSTLGVERSTEQEADLQAMGYTELHTGSGDEALVPFE